MQYILNSHNVADYLINQEICKESESKKLKASLIPGKNFNLLIELSNDNKLLIKQERLIHNQEKLANAEFLGEWHIQKFVKNFPELGSWEKFMPILVYFDPNNAIIIFKYLDKYANLEKFYMQESKFSLEFAKSIGQILGKIHSDTFNQIQYQEFFLKNPGSFISSKIFELIRLWERITPEFLQSLPPEAIKFIKLYQRFQEIGEAIAELQSAFTVSCLTHNDCKLNNFLYNNDEQSSDSKVRLIDWERANWGDPAYDLGTIIASYLIIWLSNLVVSNSISIEESLRRATIPLEALQPSIATLLQSYWEIFPEIWEKRPDFIQRIVQFVGMSLIQSIISLIQHQKKFGNRGIIMLQVAKTFLCNPEKAKATIFGT